MLLPMIKQNHSVSASNGCGVGIIAVMYGMCMLLLIVLGNQQLHRTGMPFLHQQHCNCAILDVARFNILCFEIQAACVLHKQW